MRKETNDLVADFHAIFRHGRARPGHPRGSGLHAARMLSRRHETTRVIPAKAGIQPGGHDEAAT